MTVSFWYFFFFRRTNLPKAANDRNQKDRRAADSWIEANVLLAKKNVAVSQENSELIWHLEQHHSDENKTGLNQFEEAKAKAKASLSPQPQARVPSSFWE